MGLQYLSSLTLESIAGLVSFVRYCDTDTPTFCAVDTFLEVNYQGVALNCMYSSLLGSRISMRCDCSANFPDLPLYVGMLLLWQSVSSAEDFCKDVPAAEA